MVTDMNMNKPSSYKYFLYARKSSESEDKQVASIPAQIDELEALAKRENLNVVKVFKEEKSAKEPGRSIFNEMLQLIRDGKGDAILCWKIDRLARNPVDGGQVNWMLQKNVIRHIQTHERSYLPGDNVLMMSLEFGMANQFIIDLSANTRRGVEKKAKDGWLPRKPPIGYLNNTFTPDQPPICKDPVRFHLVRKLWEVLLEKKYSMKKMKEVADQIGLRTHRNKPLSISKAHYTLTNPFYHGVFRLSGNRYEGKHEPMITKGEFDTAQAIINGKLKSREKYRTFAYTGLIRCGECGAAITAEFKTKNQKNGNTHHYTYYHCTRKVNPSCSQKPIREDRMEEQIREKVGQITIPPEFHAWAIKYLREEQAQEIQDREKIRESQRQAQTACSRKLDRLLQLRLNEEIGPEEFKAQRESLLNEKSSLEELMGDTNQREETWLARVETLLSFAEMAQERFQSGDLEVRRQILAYLGSNLSLRDGALSVNLRPPLESVGAVAPEVRALHKRLEPVKTTMDQPKWEVLYAKNKQWGNCLDDVRTYFLAPAA